MTTKHHDRQAHPPAPRTPVRHVALAFVRLGVFGVALASASAVGAQENQSAPPVPQQGLQATAQTPQTPPQAIPPPQAPPAAPQRPPVVNRLNEVLPSWLRVRAEQRSRFEGFDGGGFVSGRDDSYYLNRFRFNATVQPSASFSFTAQVQDARVADKSVGPTGAPFRDELDLRMAYADIGSAKARVATRVGRQELAFGDQRLVGHVSWLNTGRTFDGARVTYRSKPFQLDVFGSSVVAIDDTSFNESDFDASQLYGAYSAAGALVPRAVVEPYVFYRISRDVRSELGPLADLQSATIGVRWVGALPAGLDYNTEVAFQTGSVGQDDVRAWAGHWQLRDTLNARRGVRLFGEYNFASGDGNAKDGRRETFDQLYPTGHDKYGLADQVGWKNIHHLRAGGEVLVRKGLILSSSFHSWWLADAHDALYNAGGVVVARVAGGAANRHVGQELDAQAAFSVTPQLQIAGGYAHIFPGAFLKEATPGASYSTPYLMVTYVLLAEK